MSRLKKNLKRKPNKARKVKTKKVKSTTSSWREFEKLVTRIEQVLSPKGAVVKSPDFLIDKTTGEQREVDASIKFKAGTADIIITIECRERTSVQDSIWIEQLVTKQSNIGASKTIAVSANGFTDPAIRKAKLYGIEVRKITKIDNASIFGWTNLKLTRTQFNYHIVNFKVSVDIPKENQDHLKEEFKKYGQAVFDTPFCTSYNTGKPLTLRNLLEDFQKKVRGKIPEPKAPPETGHSDFITLDAKLPSGQIFITTSLGKFDLVGLRVDFTLYKHSELTATPTAAFTYADSERDLIKGVEFEIISSKGDKELISIHTDLEFKKAITTVWRDDKQDKK